MKIKIEEIQTKIKILEDKKTRAIIGLDFGDFVIKGFRIMDSKFPNINGENLWLIPPSYQGGGHYHPMIFFPDKELWQKIEKMIWDEYEIKKKEHYKKYMGVKDVDLEWESIGKDT